MRGIILLLSQRIPQNISRFRGDFCQNFLFFSAKEGQRSKYYVISFRNIFFLQIRIPLLIDRLSHIRRPSRHKPPRENANTTGRKNARRSTGQRDLCTPDDGRLRDSRRRQRTAKWAALKASWTARDGNGQPSGLHSKLVGQQEGCIEGLLDSRWAALGFRLEDGLRIVLVDVVMTPCMVSEFFMWAFGSVELLSSFCTCPPPFLLWSTLATY